MLTIKKKLEIPFRIYYDLLKLIINRDISDRGQDVGIHYKL